MEKIEKIKEVYAKNWNNIIDIMPVYTENLEMPFLAVGDVKKSYADTLQSLDDIPADMLEGKDINTDMIQNIYIDIPGTDKKHFVVLGGIAVPESCLEDDIKATGYAMLRKQIKNVLQTHNSAYWITDSLTSKRTEALVINRVYSEFTEDMENILALKVLESEGISPDEYVRDTIKYNFKKMEHAGLKPPTNKVDIIVPRMVDDYDRLSIKIKDFDPVGGADNCLDAFLEAKEPGVYKLCKRFAVSHNDALGQFDTHIYRRMYDGKWSGFNNKGK